LKKHLKVSAEEKGEIKKKRRRLFQKAGGDPISKYQCRCAESAYWGGVRLPNGITRCLKVRGQHRGRPAADATWEKYMRGRTCRDDCLKVGGFACRTLIVQSKGRSGKGRSKPKKEIKNWENLGKHQTLVGRKEEWWKSESAGRRAEWSLGSK